MSGGAGKTSCVRAENCSFLDAAGYSTTLSSADWMAPLAGSVEVS